MEQYVKPVGDQRSSDPGALRARTLLMAHPGRWRLWPARPRHRWRWHQPGGFNLHDANGAWIINNCGTDVGSRRGSSCPASSAGHWEQPRHLPPAGTAFALRI